MTVNLEIADTNSNFVDIKLLSRITSAVLQFL